MRGLRAATRSPLSSAKFTQFHFQASRTPFQLRYASTSSPALKHTSPPPQKPSDINGPLTTLPAPLELPTRAKDQSLVSHLFKTGKSYLTFYKTGVKNVYTNYQLSRKIQSRLSKKNITLQEAVQNSKITRSEFQLLHRNEHDVRRVPMFGLVLLICGEFTPLVVLAFSSVVPWTCRIPKQVDNDRRKLEKRRADSFSGLEINPSTPSIPNDITTSRAGLEKGDLMHINSSCGTSLILWEWFFGPPERLLRHRVGQHLKYLDMDDTLISRAGGSEDLSREELRMACVERGLDVMGVQDSQLRRILDGWFKNKEKVGMVSLLETRPNEWAYKPVQDPPKQKRNRD